MTPTTPGDGPGTPGPAGAAHPSAPVGSDPLDDPDARFGPDGEPMDPRQIARASLEASRNASLWVVAGAVVACVAVALIWGAAAGASALAALLAVCAVVRGVVRGPGPAVLVVRRRPVDVAVLAVLAIGIGSLAQILP